MEVVLAPGHIVLDGDPAPPKSSIIPLSAHVCCGQNGWMDQDVTWYGSIPRPCDIVLDGDPPAPHPLKRGIAATNFCPMSIVHAITKSIGSCKNCYRKTFPLRYYIAWLSERKQSCIKDYRSDASIIWLYDEVTEYNRSVAQHRTVNASIIGFQLKL